MKTHMPLGINDIQYQVFGREGTVYPGHPVSIAYLVMRSFPDFATAATRTEGRTFPAALGSGSIPGAGSNVYAALDTLSHALKYGIDAGLAYGDDYWSGCASGCNYGERHAPGQQQADSIKAPFRELFATWARPQPTAVQV